MTRHRLMESRPAFSWMLALSLSLLIVGSWWYQPSTVAAVEPEAGWQRSELYFGMKQGDGSEVTNAQWRQFLAEEITPLFPDGLTVIDGYGQYRSSMGEMIRESARIVIIIHRNDDPTVGRFQRIRDAYRQRFDQESVLWVSQSCQATF